MDDVAAAVLSRYKQRVILPAFTFYIFQMGNVDSIPVVSQIKSLVQVCHGDVHGAEQTQQEFSKRCIVVSQVRSAVEAACGDNEAALKTQTMFAEGIDAVPVLSQIKSAVQAGYGDLQAAEQTQQTFSKECAIVSQVRSAVEASCGDFHVAEQTQHQFVRGPGLTHALIVGGAIIAPLALSASLPAIGFGEGGIAAGSLAANNMTSYGGRVGAGSICAALQSAGAAGLSTGLVVSSSIAGGAVGNVAGTAIHEALEDSDNEWKGDEGDFPCSNDVTKME